MESQRLLLCWRGNLFVRFGFLPRDSQHGPATGRLAGVSTIFRKLNFCVGKFDYYIFDSIQRRIFCWWRFE